MRPPAPDREFRPPLLIASLVPRATRGLRRARPLAGIVGFSGMLAGPEILKDEIRSRPPILLAHGDSDDMLPHVLTERAAEALVQNGVAVGVHIAEGVGHGIAQTALSHAARFLLEVFKLPIPK